MDFQISVDIGAPPDVVWSVMADGERWHELKRWCEELANASVA